MRHHRSSRPTRRNVWQRLFSAAPDAKLYKAPRRRTIERLEDRQVMSANVGGNPLYGNQWHLNATGQLVEQPDSPTYQQSRAVPGEDINVIGAWTLGYTGAGVQVAVVDSGFNITHEDLAFLTSLGFDFIQNDVDATNTDVTDFHGTAVAGIIGARNNSLGGVGIAYNSDLIPVRLISGDFDAEGAPITAFPLVFTFRNGQILDLNGDGVLQESEVPPADEVVDVYNHSWGFIPLSREAIEMPEGALQALAASANFGRAKWNDVDGDGLFDVNEIEALGSIHVTAAGNDNGNSFINPFNPIGLYQSAQYDQFKNSRYVIAVGAVDYDGRYENNSSGTVTGFTETGANVLIVAPSSTTQLDIGTDEGIEGGGITTTDLTGEDGRNGSPQFNFETDGDFLGNINYTSAMNGTSASSPMVAGVVALMLEANPNLSLRDVQQILMMSARQNDQFSETWITNVLQGFQNEYQIPQYAYYNLDTDGNLATVEIEGAILPNTAINPTTGVAEVMRGFYRRAVPGLDLGNPDFDLGVAYDPMDPRLVNTGPIPLTAPQVGPPPVPSAFLRIANSNVANNPNPIRIFANGSVPDEALGLEYLLSPSTTDNIPLRFENGAGFTSSWGYGQYAEEIGYAHGVVDAELAVKLAEAWRDPTQRLTNDVTLTTFVRGGGGSPFRVQPRALVDLGPGTVPFEVTGGVSVVDIDTAFYQEFLADLATTTVTSAVVGDVGEVITGAPFYNPDGTREFNSRRGSNLIPIEFDPGLNDPFLSLEWLELRTQVASGDIDQMRLTLIAPDGTQSELNPYRPNASGAEVIQFAEGKQGINRVGFEAIDGSIGFTVLNDIISGSEQFEVGEITLDDAVPAGTAWTWSTNRHWGELFNVIGNSENRANGNDQWFIYVENFGDSAVTFGAELEFVVHGTRATGNRIQGKVGVDDNKQDISGTARDENFNFDRFVEFGEVTVTTATGSQVLTVVLDDPSDGVFYTNSNTPGPGQISLDGIYKTRDPEAGPKAADKLYAVVDRNEYLNANGTGIQGAIESFLSRTTGTTVSVQDVEFSFGTRNTDESDYLLSIPPTVERVPLSYRNFDYSQENFGSGVTVVASQFLVQRDAVGNVTSRTATGVFDRFTTGADGNYFFDVMATPAPPDPANFPTTGAFQRAYDDWFARCMGRTFEYEVSVEGRTDAEDASVAQRLINRSYASAIDATVGSVSHNASSASYTVQIFASPLDQPLQTSRIAEVNFLLETDPAETNVSVQGSVFVDFDADNLVDTFDTPIPGALVYADLNGSNTVDANEPQAVTSATGAYSFIVSGLTATTNVTVRVDSSTVDLTTLQFVTPANGTASLGLAPGSTATQNFSLQPLGGVAGILSGSIFDDKDGDGVRETGDVPLAGQRVYVDANANNVFDTGELSTLTTAAGVFTLAPSGAGTYRLRVDLAGQPFQQTSPANNAAITVALATGQVIAGLSFGLFDRRTQDYGDLFVDAGHSYPTTLAQNGARHTVVPGFFLGSGVDIELDGVTSTSATGDDFTGSDDEDGVTLVSSQILPNSTVTFDIFATGQGASLNAWIDFNDDGDWNDAGEQVAVNVGLVSGTSNRVSFNTPSNVSTSASGLAARFRWGPFGISYAGSANSGEVEDYLLPTTPRVGAGGRVAQDSDGDGLLTATDAGLAGAVVYNDANQDGVRQAGEAFGTTDATGNYSLSLSTLTAVQLTLRVDPNTLGPGFEFLNPPDGIIARVANPGQTVAAAFLVESVQTATQGVSGLVFSDLDRDAVRDAGEGGLAGVTVQLLSAGGGSVLDTTVTDDTGAYQFAVGTTGAYTVQLALSGTLQQTLPTSGGRNVTVTASSVTTAGSFGVFDLRTTFTEDFGDLAIDGLTGRNFPTTLAQNGARHTVVAGVRLGNRVEADSGALSSLNASADDLDGVDDEDGVRLFSTSILPNSTIEFDIAANGVGVLNAWVDFNGDGDWLDAGERISTDLALVSGATTRLIVSTPSTVNTSAGALAARFRWGSNGLSFTGPASRGEVEDYLLPTTQQPAATGFLSGDYDRNGIVESADRDIWLGSYGSSSDLRADGNADGRVDAADYTVWRDNLGNSLQVISLATSGPAFATSGDDDTPDAPGTPALITMPVFEPIVADLDGVSSVLPVLGGPLAEAFAVDAEEVGVVAGPSFDGDALDEALLLFSLGAVDDDEAAFDFTLFGDADDEEEAEAALASAVAEAIAL
ncbi:MAG: S8 family serine peptidase [Lacipirellulaceae bacterium]